ncbi:MAG: response regulator [Microscillaceae bacterium]|nr:response regulator [Microscillaceae bacterium]
MSTHPQIMLIDDDPINNLIIRKELTRFNPHIGLIVFESPTEALKYLTQEASKPNLILLDINMPEMNGWEFLDEFEKLSLNINLAMLTSSIAKIDHKKSQDYSSVKDYFIKPLDKDKIQKIYTLV